MFEQKVYRVGKDDDRGIGIFARVKQQSNDLDVTAVAGAADRLVVARVQPDAILVKVANDVDMTAFTCAGQWFIVASAQPYTVSLKVLDDVKVPPFTCSA